MQYTSTRSQITTDSRTAVLTGIAGDGGLFIAPHIEDIPFDWKGCLQKTSIEMSAAILSALLPDFENMPELVRAAYLGKFETDDLTPVVKVADMHVLELFRGPTSAFKDVALSVLPHLITAAKRQTGATDEVVILTATSGDTGKAALEGFHDVAGTRIIVFYPHGGVSAVQRKQMTTQEGSNVTVCAVRGNFDDCQSGVKKAFASIRESGVLEQARKSLSSANSINIGRLAPQIVYYFVAYRRLIEDGTITLGQSVDFVVPTGNFGDILAGYFAKLLGLPVGRLVCASNDNHVLTDFLTTGVYDRRREFLRTSSPSMDILISSNLERLLYLASNRNADGVACWMRDLAEGGIFSVDQETLSNIQANFDAGWCTQEEAAQTIAQCWRENGYLLDPHTAVAWNVAQRLRQTRPSDCPVVVLSTASPYKFPQTVLESLGDPAKGDEFEMMRRLNAITGVPIPRRLAELETRTEKHLDVIERDAIIRYVLTQLGIAA